MLLAWALKDPGMSDEAKDIGAPKAFAQATASEYSGS